MKITGFIICVVFVNFTFGQSDENSLDYFGLTPPGMTPRIFAPGLISTKDREFNSVFTPDGKEFYFTKRVSGRFKIFRMIEDRTGWSEPEIAPFSGEFDDFDVGISPDGNKLFFCSRRPVSKNKLLKDGYDIWYVNRSENDLSDPIHIDGIVNEGEHQIYPSVANNGTLYFTSRRAGTLGKRDVFKSKYEKGEYRVAENLGPNVNTEFDEGDAFIAPDESYIIVCAMGRPDCIGSGDLYISFKDSEGNWTKYKHMGREINSSFSDYCPVVSADGKYLFFTSGRQGSDDIYWIDASVLEEFKPKE